VASASQLVVAVYACAVLRDVSLACSIAYSDAVSSALISEHVEDHAMTCCLAVPNCHLVLDYRNFTYALSVKLGDGMRTT
jgi:hypothetical protein